MTRSVEWNFAARLVERLGANSELIDAATSEVISANAAANSIRAFAEEFAEAGLKFGDRVIIGCNLSPLSSLAYLGAMLGGFVAVPVNEAALADTGESLAARTLARALWTEGGVSPGWVGGLGMSHIKGRPPQRHSLRRDVPPCEEHDLAALMATSGSTGVPRLVKVSHGNLIANTEAIIRSQRLQADDRAMLILPLSYCFGASVLHTHLYQGGSVVFDSRFMFPDKVLRAASQHRCTTFGGVPTVYNILLRRSNLKTIALPTLRRFLQAGGALAPERVREMRETVPHAEFFVMYGQTEATSRISCLPPESMEAKLGSVGLPLDNISVRIVDSNGVDVDVGESGELWVSGKSVCTGYFVDPEESARRFRDGWLATGDIASLDDDGFLWIQGRMGEFIKMRGIRVSYAEIESRVAAVAGVTECAASRVPHVEAGEALALYVVAAAGAKNLAASIRRSMPSEWVCDSIMFISALPRNALGKLVRSQLSEAVGVADETTRAVPAMQREATAAAEEQSV